MDEPRHPATIVDEAAPGETGAFRDTPLAVRGTRMAAGVGMLAAGVVMLVLPGPGLVAIAAGLGLLSKDVPAAARALAWIRRRIPGAHHTERAPKGAVVATLTGTVAASVALTWLLAAR